MPADITVDPYTLAVTGQRPNYADFGACQPATFAKMEDILTT